MATTFISAFPRFLSPIPEPKHQISSTYCRYSVSGSSPSIGFTATFSPLTTTPAPLICKRWKLSAFRAHLFLLGETPVEENAQELVPASDDGGSGIISALLFVAFVALSILTIGVIYIAVSDFLQKREREKFEKEESADKKNDSKKGKISTRGRAGPRGFGQKIEDENGDETD